MIKYIPIGIEKQKKVTLEVPLEELNTLKEATLYRLKHGRC